MGAPTFSVTDFVSALQALMPPGRAWPRDPSSVQTSVITGLAPSFQRVTAAGNNLLLDAFPATTDQLLPEWQSTLALPDPNLPAANTLAEQQAQVVVKFANGGGQSAAYFESFAAQLGVTVTVTSSAPFRCGQSKCGQTLGTTDQFFAWSVTAPDTSLEGIFNELKPGHTYVTFNT